MTIVCFLLGTLLISIILFRVWRSPIFRRSLERRFRLSLSLRGRSKGDGQGEGEGEEGGPVGFTKSRQRALVEGGNTSGVPGQWPGAHGIKGELGVQSGVLPGDQKGSDSHRDGAWVHRCPPAGAQEAREQALAESTVFKLPLWAPQQGKFLLGACHRGSSTQRLVCLERALVLAALTNRTLLVPRHNPCFPSESPARRADEQQHLLDFGELKRCLNTPHVFLPPPSQPRPSPSPDSASSSGRQLGIMTGVNVNLPDQISPQRDEHADSDAALQVPGGGGGRANGTVSGALVYPGLPGVDGGTEGGAKEGYVNRVQSLEELMVERKVKALYVDSLLCAGEREGRGEQT